MVDKIEFRVLKKAVQAIQRQLAQIDWCTLKRRKCEKYIDRGDPASPDFPLVADNAWHDLDLSGVVASGGARHLVHLQLRAFSLEDLSEILFREKGNVNEWNVGGIIGKGTDTMIGTDIWIMLDSNRVVQYRARDLHSGLVTVRGWWESS